MQQICLMDGGPLSCSGHLSELQLPLPVIGRISFIYTKHRSTVLHSPQWPRPHLNPNPFYLNTKPPFTPRAPYENMI